MIAFGPPSARAAAIEALHAATAIYTTERVVSELLGRIDWPNGDRRLVDPSCGDGAFLEAALRRLLAAEPEIDGARLCYLLEGWEVHPTAAKHAQDRLALCLVAIGWSPASADEAARGIVRNADFLTEGPTDGPRYHVVATNPPYLRWLRVPELLRQEYQPIIPRHARQDLLYSFLDRFPALLHEDGCVAAVTCDRWLSNLNAATLRDVLGRRLGIHHIERLDVSTAFYRPKDRRKGAAPRVHPVAVVLGRPTESSILLSKAAVHPDVAVQEAPNMAAPTLGELAKVYQGPWLGKPGIFVVDAEIAQHLPQECLVPAVGPKDVLDGQLRPTRRWAIRTSRDVTPPPSILAHLERSLPLMAARGRRSPHWLPPETWGDLPLSRPSLLIRRIAKSLHPIRLPAGVLPTNHDVSIVAEGAIPLSEIEAALSSDSAQEWMRARAPRLEGGYHSITTTLLRSFPMEGGW